MADLSTTENIKEEEKTQEETINLEAIKSTRQTETTETTESEPTLADALAQIKELQKEAARIKNLYNDASSKKAEEARKRKELEQKVQETEGGVNEWKAKYEEMQRQQQKKDLSFELAEKRKIPRTLTDDLVNSLIDEALDGKPNLGNFSSSFDNFLQAYEKAVRADEKSKNDKEWEEIVAGRKPKGFSSVGTDDVDMAKAREILGLKKLN